MNNLNLNKKSEVLAELIVSTAELYDQSDEDQKGLLETLVGAAIWYLPSSTDVLFNERISSEALEMVKEDPINTKLVEEHGIPRKVAGRLLYTKHIDEIRENPARVKELYVERFGRFNLVLKRENDSLKKYQKINTFISEEEAYRQADIALEYFSKEDYKSFLKRKRQAG